MQLPQDFDGRGARSCRDWLSNPKACLIEATHAWTIGLESLIFDFEAGNGGLELFNRFHECFVVIVQALELRLLFE